MLKGKIQPNVKKKNFMVFILFLIIIFSTNATAINFNLQGNDNWKKIDIIICTAIGEHWYIKMLNDGIGGAFIVWQDNRNGDWDIYLQRISSSGIPLWADNGLVICNTSKDQSHPEICSDGEGGVFVTWYDFIVGPDYGPIYVQKVNTNGEIMWNHNGIAISDEAIYAMQPIICNDGEGGAFVVWRQGGSGIYNLYSQRINSTGHVQWNENGIIITNNTVGYTTDQQIIYDNNGGSIIVWEDDRTGRSKIYAQRFNSSGSLQWAEDGVLVCNARKGQYTPEICGDGEGGVIITWIDTRDDLIDDIWLKGDVYAQLVDSNGNLQWGENGTVICSEIHEQVYPQIVSDKAGGAIIFWEDNRTGINWDIYAQKVSSTGAVQWRYNGALICDANNKGDLYSQLYIKACSNDAGGAFIAWRDYRNGIDWDIYVQLISAGGIEQWEDNGRAICTESNDQSSVAVCSDGFGNAFISWGDKRNDPNGDIYAAKIYIEYVGPLISSYNLIIIIGLCFSIIIIIWKKREKLFRFFHDG
ncbi:MAG: hypothetical protein ACFFCL_10700 [Promethearchaeota archaeon]